MNIIVGLGDPGSKYAGTRHNIGFYVLDYIAREHGLHFTESKWKALVAKGQLWGNQVLLVKPDTFMNESGMAVGPIASYYKVDPQQIVVIHDDLDLDPAQLKLVVNRGAGGHNGITSLISHLGSKDFVRLRVGIGRPQSLMPVSNFVLSRFTAEEMAAIEDNISDIAEFVRMIFDDGPLKTMSIVNALPKK